MTIVPARSSPAVLSLPITVIVMVWAWWSVLRGAEPDPRGTSYLAYAGLGLQYALPIVGGIAAWVSVRSREMLPPIEARAAVRNPLRIFIAHTWPLYVGIGVGLALTFALQFVGAEPTGIIPDVTLLLAHLGMTIAAVGFGWILGAVLPVALAFPVAVFGLFEWIALPLRNGDDVTVRNVTGHALFMCCESADFGPDPRAIAAPLLIGIVVAVMAVLSIRLRPLVTVLVAAGVLGVAFFAALQLVSGTTDFAGTPLATAQMSPLVHDSGAATDGGHFYEH